MQGSVDWFTQWLQKPFSSDMNAWHWFLFLGLLIVISFMWRNLILSHIIEGVGFLERAASS